jgi:uncharacterized protein Yka (UPF0111/DUF47 family)
VHEKEHEADLIKTRLRKKLYKSQKDLDFLSIYHLLRITDFVDYIANHAENVEDRLRTIIAR